MNWRIPFSRYTALIGFCAAILLLTLSVNVQNWLVAFGALLLSVMLVSDGQRSYPVLVWVVGFNWLGTVAAIFGADLVGLELSDVYLGDYRLQAVNLSLAALVFYAAGIALSTRVGGGLRKLAQGRVAESGRRVVTIQNGVIAYFGSLAVSEIASFIVSNIPQLQQPLMVLYLLKFICIYLVAVTVFSEGRGSLWLIVILAVEVVSGLTSFFGTFKEAFFLVLIALVAVGRRPSVRMWAFGIASALVVLFLSLMWTAVKPEYRRWVSGYTGEQIIVRTFDERVGWMADHLIDLNFDFWNSLETMIGRVDSTSVFAQYLARIDSGIEIDIAGRYAGGIEHVVMPRILFPDKDALDDSAVTSAMTGRIIDKSTSISIGYVAEAFHDFGPRWMFLPILFVGMAVGAVGRYFMSRDAPFLVRQAFTATALFSFFQFGTNFNKALGMFLVGFAVLAIVLRYGYPPIAGWLAGGAPRRAKLADLAGAE